MRKLYVPIMLVLASLLLAGCQTNNPSTRDTSSRDNDANHAGYDVGGMTGSSNAD